jgi:hypothetical protein
LQLCNEKRANERYKLKTVLCEKSRGRRNKRDVTRKIRGGTIALDGLTANSAVAVFVPLLFKRKPSKLRFANAKRVTPGAISLAQNPPAVQSFEEARNRAVFGGNKGNFLIKLVPKTLGSSRRTRGAIPEMQNIRRYVWIGAISAGKIDKNPHNKPHL